MTQHRGQFVRPPAGLAGLRQAQQPGQRMKPCEPLPTPRHTFPSLSGDRPLIATYAVEAGLLRGLAKLFCLPAASRRTGVSTHQHRQVIGLLASTSELSDRLLDGCDRRGRIEGMSSQGIQETILSEE